MRAAGPGPPPRTAQGGSRARRCHCPKRGQRRAPVPAPPTPEPRARHVQVSGIAPAIIAPLISSRSELDQAVYGRQPVLDAGQPGPEGRVPHVELVGVVVDLEMQVVCLPHRDLDRGGSGSVGGDQADGGGQRPGYDRRRRGKQDPNSNERQNTVLAPATFAGERPELGSTFGYRLGSNQDSS